MKTRKPRSNNQLPSLNPAHKVTICYVHGNQVTHSWHQSMMNLISHDVANKQQVIGTGWLATKYGTGGIVQARNDAVMSFMQSRSADWLWWIDTDMGFLPNTVEQLMEAADPVERPIVGGLCFSMREEAPDGAGGFLVEPSPTIFDWVQLPDGRQGFHARLDYERDAVTRVAGTGSACILIHRSVFEKIAEANGNCWYSPVFNTSVNATISEDLSFCTRAGALDIPIHIHTGVRTTHMKPLWLDERVFDRLERLPRADA